MNLPSASKLLEKLYDAYSKDGGRLLIHMGAVGWIFGAAAQIGNVIGNKSIDKKQKKYLLPLEAADAAVNISLFYTVCELIKGGGDKLIEKGLLLTDDVASALAKIKPSNMPSINPQNWKKLFSNAELGQKLTDVLKNPSNMQIIKNAPASEKQALIDAAKDALRTLESHKNNVGIITSIAASIIASNILTPIARNYIAAKMQKKLQHREDVETRKTQIRENITFKNPLPKSFKAFNNYNSFAGVKIN